VGQTPGGVIGRRGIPTLAKNARVGQPQSVVIKAKGWGRPPVE